MVASTAYCRGSCFGPTRAGDCSSSAGLAIASSAQIESPALETYWITWRVLLLHLCPDAGRSHILQHLRYFASCACLLCSSQRLPYPRHHLANSKFPSVSWLCYLGFCLVSLNNRRLLDCQYYNFSWRPSKHAQLAPLIPCCHNTALLRPIPCHAADSASRDFLLEVFARLTIEYLMIKQTVEEFHFHPILHLLLSLPWRCGSADAAFTFVSSSFPFGLHFLMRPGPCWIWCFRFAFSVVRWTLSEAG